MNHLVLGRLALFLAVLSCTTAQAAAPVAPQAVRGEIEPNDVGASANAIDFGSNPGGVVQGAITPIADSDVFSFYAPAGFKVWMATDSGGTQNGGATSRDTVLDLLDSDGVSILELDDDDGTGNGGDGTIETGSASVIAGRTIVTSGTKYARVEETGYDAIVAPYILTVVITNPAAAVAETEPNDTSGSANFLFLGPPNAAVRTGAINSAGDADYYALIARAGDTLFVAADCDPERDGGTDLVVELRDGADVPLLGLDSSAALPGSAESARYTVPTTSLYYVKVRHYNAGGTGTYHLMVANVTGNRIKGDFDRDTQTDLVFRNTTNGQNDVWFMNGVVRSSLVTLPDGAPNTVWSIVGVDDFNGDMQDDLVFWNSVSGLVHIWLMNGTTRVGDPVLIGGAPVLAPNWRLSATGDFNSDGRPDIVWRNVTSQKINIWTMNGINKIGNIIPTPDQAVDGNWEIVAALDYNNDAIRDFLWYNQTSGNIVQWIMSSSVVRTDGHFTTPPSAGDSNWKVLASGDYGVGASGQVGTNDVVWRNATSGNVVVWYLDTAGARTSGTFTTPTGPAAPATDWTIVGPR